MSTTYNNGILVAFGLKLEADTPVDDRLIVPSYIDLDTIERKYDGLFVYVQDEKSYYSYDLPNNEWNAFLSTSQENTGLISIASIVQVVNQYTYTDIVWEVNGVTVSDNSHIEVINAAATGKHRTDILVGDATGLVYRIQGVESSFNSLQPIVPIDTALISIFNVFEEETNVIPPPTPGIPTLQQVMTSGSTGVVDTPIAIINYKNDIISGLEVIPEVGSELYVQTVEGEKLITISAVSDGIKILDTLNEIGFIYSGNYNVNQLANDRAITDVGGIKQLIQDNISDLQAILNAGSDADIETPFYVRVFSDTDWYSRIRLSGDGETFASTNLDVIVNGEALRFASRSDNSGYSTIRMSYEDDDNVKQIEITNVADSGIVVTDSVDEVGFVYAANYASNYVNRSLVDKEYVDGLISGSLHESGTFDASSGLFPTTEQPSGIAIRRGAVFRSTTSGTVGGIAVDTNDAIYSLIDVPGQTGANWRRFDYNTEQATPTLRGTLFLYTGTGSNTDGTITQLGITNALNLRALDTDVVHKAGVEVITGAKTFLNSSAATGAFFNNNSATTNSAALSIAASTNYGIFASNFGGTHFLKGTLGGVNSIGIDLDGANGTVGDYINIKKNGTPLAKIDYLGNITGVSFIKTGGTASQFLKANGSVDTNTYALDSGVIHTNGTTETKIGRLISTTGFEIVKDENLTIASSLLFRGATNSNLTGLIGLNTTDKLFQFQGFENGVDYFPITLQQIGGKVYIGKATDSGTGAIVQINGRIEGNNAVNNQDYVTLGQLNGTSGTVGFSNYIKYGATNVVMNGTDTVFNIPHGLGAIPTSFSISFGDASNLNFVQSTRTLTSTNIVLTCTTPPLIGSQIVYWQVFK